MESAKIEGNAAAGAAQPSAASVSGKDEPPRKDVTPFKQKDEPPFVAELASRGDAASASLLRRLAVETDGKHDTETALLLEPAEIVCDHPVGVQTAPCWIRVSVLEFRHLPMAAGGDANPDAYYFMVQIGANKSLGPQVAGGVTGEGELECQVEDDDELTLALIMRGAKGGVDSAVGYLKVNLSFPHQRHKSFCQATLRSCRSLSA